MRSGPIRRVASMTAVLALVLATSPAWAPAAAAADNVAPTVTLNVTNAADAEPYPVLTFATFTDPESATETYTCYFDFGDGTAPAVVTAPGLFCSGPDHHYTKGGSYTITVTVTDSGGASGSASANVTYANFAPYLWLVTMQGTPNVGQPMQGAVPFTDPGSTFFGTPIETYTCSFDWGDGTGAHPGTVSLNLDSQGRMSCLSAVHTYSTAGTYTITAVVTDGGGLSGSSTWTQAIAPNPAPTVTAPADSTVTAGPGVPATTFSLGSFTDPSGASAGPWQWTAVWGDGSGTTGTATTQGALSASHAYTAPGSYTLLIRVTNAAGLSGYAQATVTAVDGIGTAFGTQNQLVTEGVASTFTVYSGYNGAPSLPYQMHLNWGDGTSTDLTTSALNPTNFTHTYAAADTSTPANPVTVYTATVQVTDARGRTASASTQVGVRDVAPVLTSAPVTVPDGFVGQITLATFTDASVGPWSYAVDGGPGWRLQGQMGAPGAIQIPYDSSMGNHTFVVSVGDRGGLISTATVPVQIAGPQIGPVVVPSPLVEGQAFMASASFSALPPAHCTVDFGNGTGTTNGSISGSTCSAPNYMYPAAGTYTLTFTITDARGMTGSGHATVVVGNVPPVIDDLAISGTPSAGGVVTAQANFSHPAIGVDTYACTVDFGDGTSPQPGVVGDADCTADHTYSQGGLYTVTMTVTDNTGGSGSASVSEPIANLRPTVGTISVAGTPIEGGDVQASASFTDPWSISNFDDCSIDYGDGSGLSSWITFDQTCLAPVHDYAHPGTFTVSLAVDRGYGSLGTNTATVVVANVAPVVTPVYVPTSAQSGVNWSASVAFTDPGLGLETYSCTVDYGDGGGAQAGVISGNTCTGLSHSYTAKGSYTLVATVADSSGGSGTYSVAIAVYNVAPVVGTVTTYNPSWVGFWTNVWADFTPPGLPDTYTCTVDFGDGSGPQTGTVSGTTCQGPGHTYSVAGTFTATVSVVGSVSGAGSASGSVTVAAGPIITAFHGPSSIVLGSPVSASADFVDPSGLPVTYSCVADYGDGTGQQVGVIAGKTCQGPSHVYAATGTYSIVINVTVWVTGGGSITAAISHTIVVAAPPSVAVGPVSAPDQVNEGSSATASAPFTIVGSQKYTCTVNYGDGSGAHAGVISNSTCKGSSHSYTVAGNFTVTIVVRSSTGLTGSSSKAIIVWNVAPKMTSYSVTPGYAKIGSTVTASISFTDPGTSETYTVIFDWGDGTSTTIQLGSTARSASSKHVYKKAGVFTLGIMLSDAAATNWPVGVEIGIYDPARTSAGSGSVTAPAGSCLLSTKCSAASTATFSMSAKYAAGATNPTVSLSYSATNFSLASTGADWFAAANGIAAIRGTGKVNGVAGYTYRLTAFVGTPSSLRLLVWNSAGTLVYDLEPAPLKSGSITIK